jgi:hypothetical protein
MKTFILWFIIALAFSTIAFFACLAYNNPNSDKIIPAAIKILSATILATSLFSVDFIGSEKEEYSSKVLMIYHDNSEPFDLSSITSSIDSKSGEGFNKFKWIPSIKDTVDNKNLISKIAFEDFNYALLKMLSENYSLHWDVKKVWNQGISGGSGGISINSSAEKKPKEIDLTPFVSSISNRFSGEPKLKVFLPKGSRFSCISRRENNNKYLLKNKNYELSIDIYVTSAGRIGPSRLGQNLGRIFNNIDDWSTVSFEVELSVKYYKSKIHSDQTIKIKKWIEEMRLTIEKDFGWETIKPDFEESLTSFKWQKYVTPNSVVKR